MTPSRVRTPTLLQMELTECGAASLGIVLGYYGHFVPLSELRRVCGVSRDGSKAANVIKAARKYNLIAKGFKKSIQQLKDLSPPYIVFWNFNHFLVVNGFGRDKVYLNDPAAGPVTVSLDEFGKSYTGVVLTMEPGPEFKKNKKPAGIIGSLSSRLKGSWGGILLCLAAGFLLAFPRLLTPAITQVFIDRVLIDSRQDWLRPLLLCMGTIAILQGLLIRFQLVFLKRLLIKLSTVTSSQFIWHSLNLSVDFYSQRLSGEFGSRTILNDKVANALTGQLAMSFIDTIMMGFYLLLMGVYDTLLTGITASFAALNFAALYWIAKSRVDLSNRLLLEQGKLMGFAVSSIQSIETIKSSGTEADIFSRFAGFYSKTVETQQDLHLRSRIVSSIPTLLNLLTVALVLTIGSFRVINGGLTIGMLIAYQLLARSFLQPIDRLVNFANVIQELGADISRLDDVLQTPIENAREAGAAAGHAPRKQQANGFTRSSVANPLTLDGKLEICSLYFGYNELEPPLIQDFSLKVEPGQRIALVGPTGSGKSTISKLISGLYIPWQGTIQFSGVSREHLSQAMLAESLSVVEQNTFLFAGTIRENLTLWDRAVPESNIVAACQDAEIHSTIAQLPDGYDTLVGEGGDMLSGGQQQRLEIARALVRNPSILVLDEATSALEPATEFKIDRNLKRRGCSCLIVAHRLSTIRDCDEILVLDKGRIIQRGSHENLKQQNGLYQALINCE